MSYAAFGAGPSASAVAAAIATADKQSLQQMSVNTLNLLPAQKLAIIALANIHDNPPVQAQLSYLGQFHYSVAKLAVESAGGGVALDAMKTVGMDVLKAIYSKVGSILPAVTASMLSETASALGDVVPILGTGIAAMISVESAWQAASQDKAIKACQSYYEPPAQGTGYGGARTPADLLSNGKGTNVTDTSTVGETLGAIAENTSREAYSKSHYAAACKNGPSASCPYIPHETRMLLRALRLAIMKMRNDPSTDGGAALYPIFIDLLWAQFRLGLMNWDWAWDTYAKQVLPDFDLYEGGAAAPTRVPGGCGKYERRAYDEAKELLHNWELTVHPIYLQDQAKAKALRAAIAAAEAKLSKPKTPQMFSSSFLANIAKMMAPKTTTLPSTAAPPKPASLLSAPAKGSHIALVVLAVAVGIGGMFAYKKGYHRRLMRAHA